MCDYSVKISTIDCLTLQECLHEIFDVCKSDCITLDMYLRFHAQIYSLKEIEKQFRKKIIKKIISPTEKYIQPPKQQHQKVYAEEYLNL